MITIDPLNLLLLIELCCLLAGGLAYCLFKYKKYRLLYRDTLKTLGGVQESREELQQQLAAAQNAGTASAGTPAQRAVSTGGAGELEALRTKLQGVEEKLKEKNQKLEQLEAKLAGLEKEYVVLYQQQQSQMAQPNIP